MEMAKRLNDRQPKEAVHPEGNMSSDNNFLHLIEQLVPITANFKISLVSRWSDYCVEQ